MKYFFTLLIFGTIVSLSNFSYAEDSSNRKVAEQNIEAQKDRKRHFIVNKYTSGAFQSQSNSAPQAVKPFMFSKYTSPSGRYGNQTATNKNEHQFSSSRYLNSKNSGFSLSASAEQVRQRRAQR